jgi:pyrroline-5-carboxylate reductase
VGKIGILGLGNMGEAILRALIVSGVGKDQIIAYEAKQTRAQAMESTYGIETLSGARDLGRLSDRIIIAVKPQDAKTPLEAIAPEVTDATIIISIMAGITISTIISLLGKASKVVRVMPNICLSVAEGALGVSPNHLVSSEELKSILDLLRPLGEVAEVTEEQMDAVTALSGSGPAFVLSFLEAMIDGGVRMGLPRDKARSLAVQTMKGTVTMLQQEGLHPTIMKEMVTSAGGTTVAGLVVLEEQGFKGTVIRSLEAAQARSRELSK